MDSKKYPIFYKSMDDPDDIQKIEHTRRVRSTVTARVISRPVPSTSSASKTREVLGTSTRQPRTRYIGGVDSRRAQSSSPVPRDMHTAMDDKPSAVDENQPPYHSDLKRAQSEGDLLNGDPKLAKLQKVRSLSSLERRVRFKSTNSEGYGVPDDEQEDRKRRSRSYDELSWKKPNIEVKRKVQLLPQKEPRSRSADSGPRKGILKMKRITETSRIRISGTAPVSDLIDEGIIPQEKIPTPDKQPTTRTTQDDEMDWTPYLTKSSTSTDSTTLPEKPKEQVFKPPTRYRVQQDMELEPEVKPKSMIFTRKWKSEPSLVTEKPQRRSASADRLSSKKETKLSEVKIDLIKPIDLKPLKPAYSFGDLPSQTTVRTETKFHMKPQRWKSNPELATREKLDEIQRKPTREFETKIVRALPVHLHPLHQPKPAKETTTVKTTEVKDVSMQFTSSRDTKSEGTQVRLDPSPPLTVSTEQAYKSTQTVDQPPQPIVVQYQKTEVQEKKPKVKPLEVKDIRSYDTSEYDMTRETKDLAKKQASDKIVVEYVKEPRKPKVEERMETKIYEDHTTQVRFRKELDESEKSKQTIHVGRIDDIEMDSLTSEEDYPETRRTVKKLKTTHVDYRRSDKPEEIKPGIREEPKEQPVQVTYRGDDLTYGRIETTRKLPSTYKSEQPMAAERITVEEITFPRRATKESEEKERQRQQGLKRKKDTIEVKYERPTKHVTKVQRQTTEKADIGKFVIDETVKTQKGVKREPHVGRIEDIDVEELPKKSRGYPLQQHIGSLLVTSPPIEPKREEPLREVVKKKKPEVPTTKQEVVATRHEVIPREYVKEEVIKVRRSDLASIDTRKGVAQQIDSVDGSQQDEERTKTRETTRRDMKETSKHQVEKATTNLGTWRTEEFELAPEESKKLDERVTKYKEGLERSRKIKRIEAPRPQNIDRIEFKGFGQDEAEEPRYTKDLKIGSILIEEYPEESRDTSKSEVLGIKHVAQYPKDFDVGRLMIEEFSEEKKEIRDVNKIEKVQKSVEVSLTRHEEEEDLSGDFIKHEVIKIGKLDVTCQEKRFSQLKYEEERAKTYADDARKPDGKAIDEYVIQEKAPVERKRINRKHHLKKQREEKHEYVDKLDVGRIMIEETLEKTEERSTDLEKEKARPKTIDATLTGQEFEKTPREPIKEGIKVGKLDVTDFEKHSLVPITPKERIMSYDDKIQTVDTVERVAIHSDNMTEREQEKPRYSRDLDIGRIVIDETSGQKEEIPKREVIQSKSTEVKFTQREVETQKKEKHKYVNKLDVGRIVIEETLEKTEERPTDSKKEKVRPKSIEVTLTGQEFEKTPKEPIKESIKVGKLDVTDFEKQSLAPITPRERIMSYDNKIKTVDTIERVAIHSDDMTEREQEKPKYSRDLDIGRIVIEETCGPKEEIPKREMIQQKSTEVKFTQLEVEKQRVEEHKYVNKLDVGRIVIEETFEKTEESPTDSKKEKVRPKSIEVTLTGQEFENIPRKPIKEGIKVGKLDVTDFEEQSLVPITPRERIMSYDDKIKTVDTVERVAINSDDMTERIEQEKPRYSKDLDIGRIVIDETCGQKEEIPKREVIQPKSTEVKFTQLEVETKKEEEHKYVDKLDVGRIMIEETLEKTEERPTDLKKEKVRPKSIEVTLTSQEFEKIPREPIKQGIKVGKLDVIDFEKQSLAPITPREQIMSYDNKIQTVDTVERVAIHSDDMTERREQEKPRYSRDLDIGRIVIDETCGPKEEIPKREVIQPKSTEVKFTREIETQKKEKHKYVNKLDVGRIVIEETFEKTEERPTDSKKEKVRPKSIEVTLTSQEFEKIPRKPIKESIKVGKLDVIDFEKQSLAPITPRKQIMSYDNKIQTVDTVERVAIHSDDMTERRQDKPRYSRDLDIGRIVIDETCGQKEIPKREVIQPKSTELRFTQLEVEKQREDKHKYVNKLDVGRIVIEETLEKREETPTDAKKENVRPKSIVVTLTGQEFEKVPREPIKESIKVGKLDVTDFEKRSLVPITPRERIMSYDNKIQTVDTVEKVAIHSDDMTERREQEKPRYSRDLDIGRIVIDETSGPKEEIPKREVIQPKSTEARFTQLDVEKQREEKHKYVNKLDVGRIVIEETETWTDLKKEKVRPKSIEVTLTDTKSEDVCKGGTKEDVLQIAKFDLEKKFFDAKAVKERIKSYVDEQPVHATIEKVMVMPKYLNDRIVVEEVPEKKKEMDRSPMQEISKVGSKRNVPKVEKINVTEIEEKAMESETVDKIVCDRIDVIQKPSYNQQEKIVTSQRVTDTRLQENITNVGRLDLHGLGARQVEPGQKPKKSFKEIESVKWSRKAC
ncbi:titin-like isoform X2 [Dendronephthya gigantea]|uniref:titin-like isoform X2 n=1 Tax=Dendronephthya gigantea TaxID=151771 RepID=UPI00106BD472|nr:titin-like isoform X2 [Dendronephthya gigantea]